MNAGGLVSMHGTPVTSTLGFTFNGKDYLIPTNLPTLTLAAARRGLGDLNCDESANASDLDAFVLALINPAGYAALFPGCPILRADLNDDGAVDALDIRPFLEVVLGL